MDKFIEVKKLFPDEAFYPPAIIDWPDHPELATIGNLEILHQPLLGVFCSLKCPASLILKAQDVARELGDQGQAVISGFQSPVEKEMLTVLLRGKGSIILCPARGLGGMRIPTNWRPAIQAGKMLVISPFDVQIKRPTRELAWQRNHFSASLAAGILLIHARPGGGLESLLREILAKEKKVYAIQNKANQHLFDLGAKPLEGGV